MGFTESVTEVFVLFKMWSKHICFYIEGRRLVFQIKKAKKKLVDGLDHLPQQRWHDISHIPSNHLTKVEHQTSFFYHLRYNRSLFVVHKEATGISNELWDVKIRRTASTFGSLATCFGIPGCRSVWVAPCIWKSYITCVCIVQHTIKACFSFGFQNNAWRPLRTT